MLSEITRKGDFTIQYYLIYKKCFGITSLLWAQIPNNNLSYSGEDDLQVRSDSAYLNDCMHTYIHKWLENDWITAQGEFHLIGYPADFK